MNCCKGSTDRINANRKTKKSDVYRSSFQIPISCANYRNNKALSFNSRAFSCGSRGSLLPWSESSQPSSSPSSDRIDRFSRPSNQFVLGLYVNDKDDVEQ